MKTAALALSFLAAAAAIPASANERADASVLLDVNAAASTDHSGAVVLWGGRIVERRSEGGQTCLTVSSASLDRVEGKPRPDKAGNGALFFACSDNNFSSAEFNTGRLATIAGTLGATQERFVRGGCRASAVNAARSVRGGCLVQVPVVAVDDARAWSAPARGYDGLPTPSLPAAW